MRARKREFLVCCQLTTEARKIVDETAEHAVYTMNVCGERDGRCVSCEEKDRFNKEGFVVEKVNPPAADKMGKPSQPSLPLSARHYPFTMTTQKKA